MGLGLIIISAGEVKCVLSKVDNGEQRKACPHTRDSVLQVVVNCNSVGKPKPLDVYNDLQPLPSS